MKKSITAASGALVAGLVIAAPIMAWSADSDSPPPQAPGMAAGMRGGMGMPGGMGMMRGMQDSDGLGPRGPRGEAMRRMMMHRTAQMSPQQRCEDRVARRAAGLAYTVTKLKLTTEQQPLWDKLNAGLRAARDKEMQFCASVKTPEQRAQSTILDRTERLEQYLSMRLQNVQQVRPALIQLYQALTPEQKAVADRPFSHG